MPFEALVEKKSLRCSHHNAKLVRMALKMISKSRPVTEEFDRDNDWRALKSWQKRVPVDDPNHWRPKISTSDRECPKPHRIDWDRGNCRDVKPLENLKARHFCECLSYFQERHGKKWYSNLFVEITLAKIPVLWKFLPTDKWGGCSHAGNPNHKAAKPSTVRRPKAQMGLRVRASGLWLIFQMCGKTVWDCPRFEAVKTTNSSFLLPVIPRFPSKWRRCG